ncbi:MAG: hypothetical protein Q9M50_04130 [Methylococcales bacterium]|nr:hypothetical protein [Methylococcales bacterium]
MNIHDLQAETNAIYQEIAQMESSEAQDIVKKIFNLIERLASDKLSLETELQQLRDEVNRLKGEQGKPDIKPNKNNKGDDISSEDERKKAQVDAQKETNNDTENTDSDKKKRRRKPKIPRVKIDQTLKCLLDKTGLPSDLVSKGFAEVVIQDIVIKTNNIKYLREIFIHLLKISITAPNCLKAFEVRANLVLEFVA